MNRIDTLSPIVETPIHLMTGNELFAALRKADEEARGPSPYRAQMADERRFDIYAEIRKRAVLVPGLRGVPAAVIAEACL